MTQLVDAQRLMHLGQPQLPRGTGVLDRGDRAGRSAAVITGDGNQVGVRLGDTGGDGADRRLGDQLDRDLRRRIDLLEIEDQLRQILDGIDIVVRRRRDQCHPRHGVAQTCDQVVDLAARQLTALTGLGALCDLDLQYLGIDQVRRRDTEATGGDLLDLGGAHGAVTRRVLTTLTGVGAPTGLIHGLGQRFMCLGRQCTKRHAGTVEARQQGLDGLDFLDRQRLGDRLEGQQITNGRHRTLVDQARELLPLAVVTLLHGLLQLHHHIRVVGVVFAAMHVLDQPALLDALARQPGFTGQQLLLELQLGKAGAFDARGHAGEAHVHDFTVEADRLEQLRATIGADVRDAHLGQDLVEPLLHALAIVLAGISRVAGQLAGAMHVSHHLIGKVRVDRRGAHPEQHCHLVRVTRIAGLDHQVDARAQGQCTEVMMNGAGRQSGVDRQLPLLQATVAEYQNHLAIARRFLGLLAEALERLLEGVLRRIVVQLERLRGEGRIFVIDQRIELAR